MRRPSPTLLVALMTVSLLAGYAAHRPAAVRKPAALSVPSRHTATPLRPASPKASPPTYALAQAPDDPAAPGPLLERIAFSDRPAGTPEQIALRFVQAVQRHDDVGADRELDLLYRLYFSPDHAQLLHRVMADVRRNAQLDGAGVCDRAFPVSSGVVVVRCARLHVVVHVGDDQLFQGVCIGGWYAHDDVYRGAHTHAFTRIRLA